MNQFFLNNWWILSLIILWTLPWKGVALWKAARLKDMAWFIVIFLVNTGALLEILYIFVLSKRKSLLPESRDRN